MVRAEPCSSGSVLNNASEGVKLKLGSPESGRFHYEEVQVAARQAEELGCGPTCDPR